MASLKEGQQKKGFTFLTQPMSLKMRDSISTVHFLSLKSKEGWSHLQTIKLKKKIYSLSKHYLMTNLNGRRQELYMTFNIKQPILCKYCKTLEFVTNNYKEKHDYK